ncbi:MAG: nucleoside phosphorylase [Candidatus Thorarchaeota archaeon]
MTLETSPSNVNEIVILPAIKLVMQKILSKLQNKKRYGRVYNGELNGVKVSLIRSLIGAPNCAIVVECLRRCKTKIIIRLDVCGGIKNEHSKIDIGDILIPQSAYCDDGTSPQYLREHPSLANNFEHISNPLSKFQNLLTGNQTVFITYPNKELTNLLVEEGKSLFSDRVKQVRLWTTDGLFCESLDFIRALKSSSIQAIDMESSILFLLGKLYNLKTASLLSVTDLPGDSKFDLLTSKVIHQDMESGIENNIKILMNALPKIKYSII